jgi:hypothetical protein
MTRQEAEYVEKRFKRLEKQNDMILIYLAGMATREQFMKIKKAIDRLNNQKFQRALDIEKIKEIFKQ